MPVLAPHQVYRRFQRTVPGTTAIRRSLVLQAVPVHSLPCPSMMCLAQTRCSTRQLSPSSALWPTDSTSVSPPLTQNQPPPVFQPSHQLTILYANCRSLLPKIDHLRLLAAAHGPHLIAICKTWLDKTISNDELFIPDFSLIHRDRDRHGGGIAMFIHESLSFSVRQTHPAIELLLVDLKTKRSRLSCGLYYRPPSADPSDLASLETALEELPPLCVNSFLLMGDLNINLLSSSHQPILQSIVDKLGLTQIVSAPTRVTQNTSTLIDHAYVSENLSKVNCSVQPPVDGSDHNSFLLTVKSILPARGNDRRRSLAVRSSQL